MELRILMDETQLAAYDALVRDCGLQRRKQLLDLSLTLLKWAVEESQKGRDIASVNPSIKHIEFLRILELQQIKDRARKHTKPNLLN